MAGCVTLPCLKVARSVGRGLGSEHNVLQIWENMLKTRSELKRDQAKD